MQAHPIKTNRHHHHHHQPPPPPPTTITTTITTTTTTSTTTLNNACIFGYRQLVRKGRGGPQQYIPTSLRNDMNILKYRVFHNVLHDYKHL
jgi:hypothetical protein